MQSRLVSTTEAARILDKSERQTRRILREHGAVCGYFGGRIKYMREDVEYIRDHPAKRKTHVFKRFQQ